jgi:hypothetical protein
MGCFNLTLIISLGTALGTELKQINPSLATLLTMVVSPPESWTFMARVRKRRDCTLEARKDLLGVTSIDKLDHDRVEINS